MLGKKSYTDMNVLTGAIPKKPGFYWAQWRILADGSSTEDLPPVGTWEVVDVFANTFDPSDPEHFRVHVAGESKGQPIENFFWGPGPLQPPNRGDRP